MSSFLNDFPSFKNQIPSGVCDQCDDGYYFCTTQIMERCLDKVKAKEQEDLAFAEGYEKGVSFAIDKCNEDMIKRAKVKEAIEKERDICDKMATKVEGNDDFMFNQFKARILTCERLLQSLDLDGEQK